MYFHLTFLHTKEFIRLSIISKPISGAGGESPRQNKEFLLSVVSIPASVWLFAKKVWTMTAAPPHGG